MNAKNSITAPPTSLSKEEVTLSDVPARYKRERPAWVARLIERCVHPCSNLPVQSPAAATLRLISAAIPAHPIWAK